MYLGYGMDPTFIILIPVMIFAFVAQAGVKNAFSKYSQVRNKTGLTGAQAARQMLDAGGLTDVQIIPGNLTDHYDPTKRTLNLSETVCNVNSVSAVSVACHEAGHALQHAEGYTPLTVRNTIVPVVNFASSLSWILIMIGLGLLFGQSSSSSGIGTLVFDLGCLFFICVVAFHLITLPVEFNASSRALTRMQELSLVSSEDVPGAKKVLRAAAMTYVAAAATSIANLIRILLIRSRSR